MQTYVSQLFDPALCPFRFEEYVGQLATTAAVAGASTEEGHVVAPSPMASKTDKQDLHEIQQVGSSCTCPPHCFRRYRLQVHGAEQADPIGGQSLEVVSMQSLVKPWRWPTITLQPLTLQPLQDVGQHRREAHCMVHALATNMARPG